MYDSFMFQLNKLCQMQVSILQRHVDLQHKSITAAEGCWNVTASYAIKDICQPAGKVDVLPKGLTSERLQIISHKAEKHSIPSQIQSY